MSMTAIKTIVSKVGSNLDRVNASLVYVIEATVLVAMASVALFIYAGPIEEFTQVQQGLWAGIAGASISIAALVLTRWLRDWKDSGETA